MCLPDFIPMATLGRRVSTRANLLFKLLLTVFSHIDHPVWGGTRPEPVWGRWGRVVRAHPGEVCLM